MEEADKLFARTCSSIVSVGESFSIKSSKENYFISKLVKKEGLSLLLEWLKDSLYYYCIGFIINNNYTRISFLNNLNT